MANVNPKIWGDSSTWIYSDFAYGLTSDLSKIGNFDKPKVNNFGGADNVNKSTLVRALNRGFLIGNEYIDNTLCPCGQSPDVSPFAKIAIFNENNDLSLTPRLYTITDSNINWFFADRVRQTGGAMAAYSYYNTYYDSSNEDYSLSLQQFAPKRHADSTNDNCACLQLSPYVYYGIKSLLLSIEVNLMSPDGEYPTQASWHSLDSWKNNYPTYSCVGMRLFVRNCTAYNNNQLTYNDSEGISDGQASYLCVTNPIPVVNNGTMTPTQFLTQFSVGPNVRCAYIFNYSATIYNYNDYRRNRAVLPCWNYFEGQTLNRYLQDSNTCIYYYKIPYNQTNYDKMLSIAALFGCYFTPTNKYQFDYNMLDNDLYLTVLDDNGVAHGQYTRGADNANNSLYSKGSIREIDYNPDTPPTPVDPNTYSVTTGFNTVGNVASTTKAYVVNAAALTGLSGEMWNIINKLVTSPDDMTNLDNLTLDAFLTNNPIDAIVSVKKFPLSSVPHAETLENIYLGKYQTGAAGYALAMQQARYNFEGIPIFPKFGNCFLDYGPYTKMQLYVPFCGTIDIDAADFMGRTLSVEMVIDFITGSVTAYVLANQLVVTSLTGSCAIDIPITGTEQSTVSASLENAIIQEKSARGSYTLKGSVGGMLTNPIGNITHPSSALENRFNTKLQTMQANYNLQHVEMPLRQIGNASPLNSWALEFVCRLIIYYPDGECITFNATNEPSLVADKVESFGAVNGFATVETNTLSSYTGFTQVSDADLSGISATDTEKEMILSLLQSGVYL